jgi:hypothetical protein
VEPLLCTVRRTSQLIRLPRRFPDGLHGGLFTPLLCVRNKGHALWVSQNPLANFLLRPDQLNKHGTCCCIQSASLRWVASPQGNALTKNCTAATDYLDVCSDSASAPADMSARHPALETGAAAGPSQFLTLPGLQTGGADVSGHPADTDSTVSQSQNNLVPVAM